MGKVIKRIDKVATNERKREREKEGGGHNT